MRKTLLSIFLLSVLGPTNAHAEEAAAVASTKIVEGAFADTLYAQQKGKAQTLAQKGMQFILKKPGSPDVITPAAITVKPAEFFFIKNEEIETTHNVYDDTDTSWLLQKQAPGSVAAIMFTKPGVHHLLCAIHPQMQLTVNVVP